VLTKAHHDPFIPFRNADILEFLRTCHVSTRVEDDGRVALTSKQVELFFNIPLAHEMECLVRDMFVLQCLTSLRYSNVTGADFRPFRGQRDFEVVQVKEKGSINQHISLDIDPRIEQILNRHDWHFPVIKLSTYNAHVRRITQQLPFANEMVQIKTRLADGSTRVREMPFYEAIRSHNGRRTFITKLRGNPMVQDRDLATFTGHRTISLLAIYDKTSKQHRAENVLRALGCSRSQRNNRVEK